MKRATIWRCNGCGKEVIGITYPPHWFSAEIYGDHIDLQGDYCSKTCLEKALMEELKFIEDEHV